MFRVEGDKAEVVCLFKLKLVSGFLGTYLF
jgi:hypothetical protein